MTIAISERTVEVPWILDIIRKIRPETLLDVGFAGGWYLQQIIDMGIKCTGLDASVDRISGLAFLVNDNKKAEWVELAKKMTHIINDITRYPVIGETYPTFPMVICVSTIEHIVPCGYQNHYCGDMNTDIKAITNMKKLVTSGGSLILTLPCGQERFFYNKSRDRTGLFDPKIFTAGNYDMVVYSHERLARLIGDWQIVDQQFWTRHNGETGSFAQCSPSVAFTKTPSVETPVQSVCAVRMVAI